MLVPEDVHPVLLEATKHEDVEIAKLLLDAWPKPDADDGNTVSGKDRMVNMDEGSIIQAAVETGNIGLVKLLLEAGARLEGHHVGHVTLKSAAAHKDATILKYLIDAGANVSFVGAGALIVAVEEDNLPAVEMLMDANVDPYDVQLRCWARVLLDRGATVFWPTVFAACDHEDILKDLLRKMWVQRPTGEIWGNLFDTFLEHVEVDYCEEEFNAMMSRVRPKSRYRFVKEWMGEREDELCIIYEAVQELRREEREKEAEKGL
ncbi:hypothetical protein HDV00_012731 [Rhizophlyctis rosea]|nr:hypothetical protein HDV00_012731 [Rhizophlyctis rosea]